MALDLMLEIVHLELEKVKLLNLEVK